MSIDDIFIFGDIESRTKTSPDFIANDQVHMSALDTNLQYSSDNQLTESVNPDLGHNEYGQSLLSICKSTAMRIVNETMAD